MGKTLLFANNPVLTSQSPITVDVSQSTFEIKSNNVYILNPTATTNISITSSNVTNVFESKLIVTPTVNKSAGWLTGLNWINGVQPAWKANTTYIISLIRVAQNDIKAIGIISLDPSIISEIETAAEITSEAKVVVEDARDLTLTAAERAAESYKGAASSEQSAAGFAEAARRATLGEAIPPEALIIGGDELKHNHKYIINAVSGLDMSSVALETNATIELWIDFSTDPSTLSDFKLPNVYWLDGTSSTSADEHDIPYLPSETGRCHYVIREETGMMVGHMSYFTPIPASN